NILQKPEVAAARKTISEARNLMEFPRDQDGLIHYLTAEAILSRYVHGAREKTADLGEAYYLLGVVSEMTEHSIWINRSEFYLESAIRLAPSEPFALKAYALLEENVLFGYTGSSGTHIPEDV